MSGNKKFWYIQLDVNFFENEIIDWLCEQENGYQYVVLYIKLCLKTANTSGVLKREIGNMVIPYDFNKIAEITKMKVDTVIVAFELFKNLGLIYKMDEERNLLKIPAVENMVGYTTQWAIDKAKQRAKEKQKELDNVQFDVQDNVTQELRVKSLELKANNLEKDSKEKDVVPAKQSRSRFVPPTFDEVSKYCSERKSDVDPKKFFDYFETSGWVDGNGKKVKNWKQKIITWEGRGNSQNKKEQGKGFSYSYDCEEGTSL